ncbi:MAG TPA: lysophospholipid acyltransferase family protein [Verrucomicrobiae bacterium]|nr:lysophospholipid acyltransferase family protein [Verrucomicrobiae bacterium]
MLKLLRCVLRSSGLIVIAAGLPVDWLCSILLAGRRRDHPAHARLLHRWARFTTWLAGCRVTFQGQPPSHGLCISNHLSYLDIAAYGSVAPMLFVSKHEVRRWPLFGQWAAMCGTLFIQRERKGHVADVGEQMGEVLRTGAPLVVFPEGTSSGGETVLPFKSSLFQPAIDHQWPVTPMRIDYELPGGSVSGEVAYWGDMTLLPHLLNLFKKRNLRAIIRFGEPLPPGTDRKDLCRRAHAAVVNLGVESEPV